MSSSRWFDVLVEHRRLCQKGDTFWHHHGIRNFLPPCSLKFSPLFQFFDQSGKRYRRVIGPHNIYGIFFQVDFVYCPVSLEDMLYYGKGEHLPKSCQLVHQWGHWNWFNHCDDLLFLSSANGSVFSEQHLILSELLSSERLFLDVSHGWRVIARVVQRHKCENRLFCVFLACNCQCEVSMRTSSKVWQHRRRIPTDQSI